MLQKLKGYRTKAMAVISAAAPVAAALGFAYDPAAVNEWFGQILIGITAWVTAFNGLTWHFRNLANTGK